MKKKKPRQDDIKDTKSTPMEIQYHQHDTRYGVLRIRMKMNGCVVLCSSLRSTGGEADPPALIWLCATMWPFLLRYHGFDHL